jgi:hypothetical protein
LGYETRHAVILDQRGTTLLSYDGLVFLPYPLLNVGQRFWYPPLLSIFLLCLTRYPNRDLVPYMPDGVSSATVNGLVLNLYDPVKLASIESENVCDCFERSQDVDLD